MHDAKELTSTYSRNEELMKVDESEMSYCKKLLARGNYCKKKEKEDAVTKHASYLSVDKAENANMKISSANCS